MMGAPALSMMDALALAACDLTGGAIGKFAKVGLSTALSHPKPSTQRAPEPKEGGGLLFAFLCSSGQQDAGSWGQARIYGAIGWGGMHLILGPLLLR